MKVVVEADGGSRGNPGPAGYGAVVLDAATEEVLAERSAGLGVATNNVAEYQGLLAGLRAAIELGATDVEVRMDSKLVVEQMSGRWQVKHPAMRPLAAAARGLVGELGSVHFGWIPRARNARADALANAAMDAQATASTAPSTERTALSAEPIGRECRSFEPAEAATRLLLLRHGETEMSVQRCYCGRADPELTAVGHTQAAGAAARLVAVPDIAAVLTSPLRRARQTAAAVADATGAPLHVRDGLVETDFGAWDGLTFAQARARDPELHARWLGALDIAPPGGESFAEVAARVATERAEILAAYPGAKVVLVTHVTPIKLLLRDALAAGPRVLHRLHLDLASLSTVDLYLDGGASVGLVNDTCHLT